MRIALVLFLAACSSSNKPPATPPPTGSDTPAGSGSAIGDSKCTDPKPAPDSVCLQDCGPPVAREGDPPPAWRWVTPDDAKARELGGCPRCLPPTARIATPFGDMPVSTLVEGAIVWSQN